MKENGNRTVERNVTNAGDVNCAVSIITLRKVLIEG